MRRLAVTVAAGSVLLAVTGCGHTDHKPAAQGTRTPTSASTTLGPGEIAPKTLTDDLLTAMRKKSSARISLSLSGGITGTGDVSYGATTDARISVRYGTSVRNVITAGGNTYFQQSAGGKYTRVSADDPAMGGFVKQLAYIGPREALGAIAPGITKVKQVATTGPTRSYQVTLDGKVAGDALTFGATDVPKTIELTFITLDNGLLIDVVGDLGSSHLKLEISRWGVPVHVRAPARSDLLNP